MGQGRGRRGRKSVALKANYLDYTDSRANINQKVRKYFRMIKNLEDIWRILVPMKLKHFVRNVLQKKVSTSDEAFHLVLFVNSNEQKLRFNGLQINNSLTTG